MSDLWTKRNLWELPARNVEQFLLLTLGCKIKKRRQISVLDFFTFLCHNHPKYQASPIIQLRSSGFGLRTSPPWHPGRSYSCFETIICWYRIYLALNAFYVTLYPDFLQSSDSSSSTEPLYLERNFQQHRTIPGWLDWVPLGVKDAFVCCYFEFPCFYRTDIHFEFSLLLTNTSI